MNETTVINGREYTVTAQVVLGEFTAKNSIDNGFEPFMYQIEGARGASYIAYKSIKTGQYEISGNLNKIGRI